MRPAQRIEAPLDARRVETSIAIDTAAQEHLIPPSTLDGGVELHLWSETRVSTTFHLYAGWWADRAMRSIQEHILAIVKARSERGVSAGQ